MYTCVFLNKGLKDMTVKTYSLQFTDCICIKKLNARSYTETTHLRIENIITYKPSLMNLNSI